jgi:predicted nucleic acid-binding protein
MPCYLDTSAFVKLVVREEGTAEMRAWADAEVGRAGALWSSDLLRTEAVRTARRAQPEALSAVRDRLDRMALIVLTTDTFRLAAEINPTSLQTLDAVHLAAALALGDDLDGVVTYDERMAESAQALGIPVVQP